MATDLHPPLSTVEVFDRVGPAYEEAFQKLGSQEESIQWLLTQLPPATASLVDQPARILDVGSGTGRPVAHTLAAAGHDVLGIDISPTMVQDARRKVPNARFELIDVRDFLRRHLDAAAAAHTSPATYDGITVYFSLIAGFESCQAIRDVIAGLARLLKPGGSLVFATVALPAENKLIHWFGLPVSVSSLDPDDVLQTVRDAGLSVVCSKQNNFQPHHAGICRPELVWEEPHIIVYAKKPLLPANGFTTAV